MGTARHRFPYDWTLKDAVFAKDKGRVFSCFACGGGSSMGYKLAGFDVIGCNEIDPRMMECYTRNLHPLYAYCEDIRIFKERDDLPADLYDLDILDGSPPCSSFSTNGVRDRDWGREKVFAEGQKSQVLDTLFFDFIDVAEKLRPKVVVAENVKGLVIGKARSYVTRILKGFDRAGYDCRMFLLNAAYMGVPQLRERVIFIATRRDLGKFDYNMKFSETPIPLGEFADFKGRPITGKMERFCWGRRHPSDMGFGNTLARIGMKKREYSRGYCFMDRPLPTLTTGETFYHFTKPLHLSDTEVTLGSSFPRDYDFCGRPIPFITGMSVPPVMMANVAARVWDGILAKVR